MLDRAQDLFKQLTERVKTTMQVVADLAESVGVPPAVTSLLQRNDNGWTPPEYQPPAAQPAAAPEPQSTEAPAQEAAPAPAAEPEVVEPEVVESEAVEPEAVEPEAVEPEAVEPEAEVEVAAAPAPKKAAPRKKTRRATKKRVVEGNKSKSAGVKPLQVDDAINGSTYLARIIWSLGVANLEGLGPLRPADVARMVMSRSAVSLEPPNVARYIRRSKPTCIVIAQKEGSSSYYKLNAAGRKLFDEKFGPDA